jgi:hypothetical protein
MSDKQAHVICDNERFPLFSTDGAIACAKNIVEKFGRDEYGYRFMEIGFTDDDPETVVVLADWNSLRKAEKAIEALNRADVPIEALWSDEYSQCDACYKFVRTSPDSYAWTPQYVVMEEYVICRNCVNTKMQSKYIKMLTKSPLRGERWMLNTILSDKDLEDNGFTEWDDNFETGFHEYQDDDPSVIAKYLWLQGVTELLFSCVSQEQFYTRFSAWIKLEEGKEAPPIPRDWTWAHGYSSSSATKAMLKGV